MKKEAKLKGRRDKRRSHSSEIQGKLKIQGRETQDNWSFAKISAERKHQRFKKEAPQKAWETEKFHQNQGPPNQSWDDMWPQRMPRRHKVIIAERETQSTITKKKKKK